MNDIVDLYEKFEEESKKYQALNQKYCGCCLQQQKTNFTPMIQALQELQPAITNVNGLILEYRAEINKARTEAANAKALISMQAREFERKQFDATQSLDLAKRESAAENALLQKQNVFIEKHFEDAQRENRVLLEKFDKQNVVFRQMIGVVEDGFKKMNESVKSTIAPLEETTPVMSIGAKPIEPAKNVGRF